MEDAMRALIRHGLAREGHSRLGRDIGQDLERKRICIPQVGFDWNPVHGVGTCFWFLINQPETGDRMLLKEAGKFVVCHLVKMFAPMGAKAAAGDGVVGNIVEHVHRAREFGGHFKEVAGLATGHRHEVSERMRAANAASTAYGYHAAQGTDAETFMSLNYYQIGGVSGFICRPGVSRLVMFSNVCGDKSQFVSLYRHVEGRWRGDPEAQIPQVWKYAVASMNPRGVCVEGDGTHGEVAVPSGEVDTYRNYEHVTELWSDNLVRV
jgi:hypothetical protein